MRRRRVGFAWVAMMDLLFGLFGALVILTVLITLKLGKDSGIERRAFHLITMEAHAADREVANALARMALNFDLSGATCKVGANFRSAACEARIGAARNGAPVTFRSAVNKDPVDRPFLASALFVGAGDMLKLTPFLSNVSVLEDLNHALFDKPVQILVNVKSGTGFWAPEPFCVPVRDLIALAKNDTATGFARLNFCALKRCSDAQPYRADCKVEIDQSGGSLVLE